MELSTRPHPRQPAALEPGSPGEIGGVEQRVLKVLCAASQFAGDDEISRLGCLALSSKSPDDSRAVVEAIVRKHASIRSAGKPTWVVSGNGVFRALVSEQLASITEVVRFDRGADVLEWLASAQEPPALMVLDTVLSDGSGLELLAQLRSDVTLAARILVVGPPSVYGEARALGAQIMIPDPMEHVVELTTTLEAMLGVYRGVGIEVDFDPTTTMVSLSTFRDVFVELVDACATLRSPGWTFLVVEPAQAQPSPGRRAQFATRVLNRLDGVLAASLTPKGRLAVLVHSTEACEVLTSLLPAPPDVAEPSAALERDDALPDLVLTGCVGSVATWTELEEVLHWPATALTPETRLPQVGRSAGYTVLLAEGSPVTATFITTVLRHLGLNVVVRGTGTAVQQLIRDESVTNISLVLLDLYLPGADGLELLTELRSSPRYANTPVMLISASDDARHHVAALKSGADDYLVKPVAPAVLQERVRRVLERTVFANSTDADLEITEEVPVISAPELL